MLIFLEDNILKSKDELALSNALFKAVMAHRDGNHYIVCSQDFLEHSLVTSNPIFLEAFLSISQRYVDLDSLISSVSVYATLVDSSVPIEISSSEDIKKISINLNTFSQTSIYLPTYIIFEDLNDTNTYLLAAQLFIASNPSVFIRISPINGGGSNTPKAISQFASNFDKDMRFINCLYDSDIKFNGGPRGSTALGISSAAKHANLLFSEVMVNSHEVENLYFPSIIQDIVNDVNASDLISLVNAVEQNAPELYRYIDMKGGIRVKNIKYPLDTRQAELNVKLAELVNIDVNDPSNPLQTCACPDRKNCECIIHNGYPKLITAINRRIESVDHIELEGKIPDHVRAEWFRLGKLVASWGLAAESAIV